MSDSVNVELSVQEFERESHEPEGGWAMRHAAFLAERLAILGPKNDEADDESDNMEVAATPLDRDFSKAAISEMANAYFAQRKMHLDQLKTSFDVGALGSGYSPTPSREAYRTNQWISVGPAVVRKGQSGTHPAVSGRIRGIAPAADGHTVYVASANGGVWKSTDGGSHWVPLMNKFDLNPLTKKSDTLACGALALDPNNPQQLFVGSGEGGGGEYMGVGPVVSSDGGKNWQTETSSPDLKGYAFYELAVDPNNTSRVIGATTNGLYLREPKPGSSPQTYQWERHALGGQNHAVTSVVVSSKSGVLTFYAASNSVVYSSTDGKSWAALGTGFPAGAGRVTLATPKNQAASLALYALVQNGDVWHLVGSNWKKISGVPNCVPNGQGDYDLAMTVNPGNHNQIFLGGDTVSSGGDWSAALYRVDVNAAQSTASYQYIGNSVHPDVHAIVFVPGDSNKMWVGCDGGLFYTNKASTTNQQVFNRLFEPKNAGLSTMTVNWVAQHPYHDAVLFASNQDNGATRYVGDEAWQMGFEGDSGRAVFNWDDPYRILVTYVYASINRSKTAGGNGSFLDDVSVPLYYVSKNDKESTLFYSPFIGTPINRNAKSEANIVAFGSSRPWISSDFGNSWKSIPHNAYSQDNLTYKENNQTYIELIRSLCFATAKKLYVGTYWSGQVYRFDQDLNGRWTKTRLDNKGNRQRLPINGAAITSIAVDPVDKSGNSIYVTFAGQGDYRHVWHFDGSVWEARSGPAAGDKRSLLDVQHNSILVDPYPIIHQVSKVVDASNSSPIKITTEIPHGLRTGDTVRLHNIVGNGNANGVHTVTIPAGEVSDKVFLLDGTTGNGTYSRSGIVDREIHPLYVAADIGIWRSLDGGATWHPYSYGLPDAAVIDLKIFPPPGPNGSPSPRQSGDSTVRLLRAATYGRGVFEHSLDASVRLVPAIDSTSSTGEPYFFYKNEITYNYTRGKILLASNPDGTGEHDVDDAIRITVNGVQKWDYDYSHGNHGVRSDPPKEVSSFFQRGENKILVELYDKYPVMRYCSSFYLVRQDREVELYVRKNILDRGRYDLPIDSHHEPINLNDPINKGKKLSWHDGPDVKVSLTNHSSAKINFYQFAEQEDDSQNQGVTSGSARLYVQVHNLGIKKAVSAKVTILQAALTGGQPPALPAGYTQQVAAGQPISGNGWSTLGTLTTPSEVTMAIETRVPQVVSLDKTAQGGEGCILILLSHPEDLFENTETDVKKLCIGERKASVKFTKFQLVP